jgi:hypothetical protein
MSIETRHVETDALGALRAELVGAARRRVARRRRRRRLTVVAAALAALLALAAGAAALTGWGTGVPVVDDLLEVEGGSLVGEPAGDATEPLPMPPEGGTGQALAFLTKDGRICHAEAERHPTIEGSVRGGSGGCWPAADLARKLDRRGIVWSASSHGPDFRTYNGYADGDIQSIRVVGEMAGADVRMTPPWTPRMQGAGTLRFVVVVDERDIDVGDDGFQPGDLPITMHPRVEVTYADGRTEVIRPP